MRDVPALELANAKLDSTADLGRWLAESGDWAVDAKEEMALRLPDFVRLRETIRDLLEASIDGGSFPAAAVERLNEISSRVPRALQLDVGSGRAVEFERPAGATASGLAVVARSAIQLLGSADGWVRRCASCGRFFLAKRRDRVWCSQACGNRARVARHYMRRARA